MEKLSEELVDYGVATVALSGESRSGDASLVQPFAGGVLLGVIDGLGHGPEAAEAAQVAVQTLREHAGESVIALARRCHTGLQRHRGAVMSIASLDAVESSMTWMGVGNVSGVLLRADETESLDREVLLLRSGVVGSALPPLRASVVPVFRGDTLILATDGIEEGFYDKINIHDAPQNIADRILHSHGKGTDDALVLVAQFLAETA
jgi:negative regulator of sigma-B (phosphoserine phosphatase)